MAGARTCGAPATPTAGSYNPHSLRSALTAYALDLAHEIISRTGQDSPPVTL
jgi:hypothetical protein